MRIDSVARCKNDFYGILKLKMKPGTSFEKKTAQVLSLDFFFDRDYFRGEIDEDSLWIMRPRRITIPLAQRVFSGFYTETDGHVVVYGSFQFASYEKRLNIVFSIVVAFFSFYILLRIPPISTVLAIISSLIIGVAFWGCIIGMSLITSRHCEEDVIRLMSTLR